MNAAFNLLIETASEIALENGADAEEVSVFRNETVFDETDLEMFLDEMEFFDGKDYLFQELPDALANKLNTQTIERGDLEDLQLLYILEDLEEAMGY